MRWSSQVSIYAEPWLWPSWFASWSLVGLHGQVDWSDVGFKVGCLGVGIMWLCRHMNKAIDSSTCDPSRAACPAGPAEKVALMCNDGFVGCANSVCPSYRDPPVDVSSSGLCEDVVIGLAGFGGARPLYCDRPLYMWKLMAVVGPW